jgi:tripartite-type tricarboxylate transporter receptor subunit TctC
MRRSSVAAWIMTAALAWTSQAFGQDAANDFYRGKTVTIIAGSSAGGGVDLYARLVAQRLSNHIPGNPTVIVQNEPGAGSLSAAHNLYSVAPRDGTQMAVTLAGALFDPLMNGRDLKDYDPRQFQYIGNADADASVCLVRRDAAVKQYGDLFTKQLLVAGTGPGSALVDDPVFERNLLGVKLKLVAGYRGSNEISLAVRQNEAQGVCGLLWSSAKQQYPDVLQPNGLVKVLAEEDTKLNPELQKFNVPLVVDFAKTNQQKELLGAFLEQGSISRPFFMPPGVPADRIQIMRKAFMETMKDPEVLAAAVKQQSDVAPASGEDVQALVRSIYSTPPDLVALMRKDATMQR